MKLKADRPDRRLREKLYVPEAESAVCDLRRRLEVERRKVARPIRRPTEPIYDEIYAAAWKAMQEEEGGSPYIVPSIALWPPEDSEKEA